MDKLSARYTFEDFGWDLHSSPPTEACTDKGVVKMKVIRIRGRNRIDVKKRVLKYYFSNCAHQRSIKGFLSRCTIDPSGKTIIYREEG